MKKLLILFMAFGLLTACNNKKAKDGDKTTKDTIDNKDTKEVKDNMGDGDKTTDVTTDNTVTGWPQKDRDDFLSSCINEAVKSGADRPLSEVYCECMLGKVEEKYPDVKKAGALTDEEIGDLMRQYAPGCRGE